MIRILFWLSLLAAAPLQNAEPADTTTNPQYDVVIYGGTLFDGSGGAPYIADIGMIGDQIVAIGDLDGASSKTAINAKGLAVAPGFINVLSWGVQSLIVDGRAQSNIRQGVTLEVFGEGWSMGPLSESMKQDYLKSFGLSEHLKDLPWNTLGEYLAFLEQKGVSPNIASFVGATTVRINTLGYEDRAPTKDELQRMQELVREAMNEGALGVGSSLIYAPGTYAETDELVALSTVAAQCKGIYISHLRSEGDRFLEAVDELLSIAKRSGAPAEIHHLKAAGRSNWHKLGAVIDKVNQARSNGLSITANMYPYIAGATGLDAAMPPWSQEGGHDEWVNRLKDKDTRARIIDEIGRKGDDWENLYHAAGSPDNLLLIGFNNPELQRLTGKTVAEVAKLWGLSPEETIVELVIRDNSRVGTAYFLMSEKNIEEKVVLPWMSFGSDEGVYATEGQFLEQNPHPRAYGTFAKVLATYVREKKLLTLQEAIHRFTALPAKNFNLVNRGQLKPGFYADIVIFDPKTVQDFSTYKDPHKYSTGVHDVWVNGVRVLNNGEHTGALPGRVVRGAGFNNCRVN